MAIDEHVWVSNSPKNTVTRIDPKAQQDRRDDRRRQEPVLRARRRASAACGCPTAATRASRGSTSRPARCTATLPMTIGNSEGGVATGAGQLLDDDRRQGHARARSIRRPTRSSPRSTSRPDRSPSRSAKNAVWVTSTEKNLADARQRAAPTSSRKRSPSARSRGSSPSAKGRCGRSTRATARSRASTPRPTRSSRRSRPAFPGGGGEICRRRRIGVGRRRSSTRSRASIRRPTRSRSSSSAKAATAIRVGHGSVWLSNLRQANIWRLDPKRIEATTPE